MNNISESSVSVTKDGMRGYTNPCQPIDATMMSQKSTHPYVGFDGRNHN